MQLCDNPHVKSVKPAHSRKCLIMSDTFGIENISSGSNTDWQIVGIDPAPASKSTICYLVKNENKLAFKDLKHQELLHFIQSYEEESKVLVVWDAPLTGPPILKHSTESKYPQGYFTQRDIEKFFMRDAYRYQTPTGINTQGYSGCQHWTITKAFTGLPLLGPLCQQDDLPFHHVSENVEPKVLKELSQPCIVEAHPALAIYLWIKHSDSFTRIKDWNYKKDEAVLKNFIEVFIELTSEDLPIQVESKNIKSDDHLDAFVAWALGYFYITQNKDQPVVSILGNQKTGSMLLPYEKALFEKFENAFMKEE